MSNLQFLLGNVIIREGEELRSRKICITIFAQSITDDDTYSLLFFCMYIFSKERRDDVL